MKAAIYVSLIMALLASCGIRISAQTPASPSDLTTASLEELMNLEVTTVSKKEEKLFQTAAAVYVITREDIRRSGLTSIPELLRLAPGLQVLRIDGNKWAISARGFNTRFVKGVLVLIDGRSIYSPETSGVYWEAQILPVEEIERIEVIRGPGGTLWGVNAVDGIINIITRPAGDTQGGLLTVGGGSEEQGFTTVRYGDRMGGGTVYRVYGRYFKRSSLIDAAGRDNRDGERGTQGGFRLDSQLTGHDALTVQGDIYDAYLRETSLGISPFNPFAPPTNTPGEFTGGNVLGKWNHTFSERSDLSLQMYFDRSRREVVDIGERFDTFDIDFQHRAALGRRQEIVWGLGYRLVADQTNSNSGTPVRLSPKGRSVQIFSAFVQDELTLVRNRLRLTLGSKVEHNDYTGYEVQPSARLLLTPSRHQTVWVAASRATSTPTRLSRDQEVSVGTVPIPGSGPLPAILFGNRAGKSEEFRSYELGYRIQPASKLSLDLATFYTCYDRGVSFDPGPPFFQTEPFPTLILPSFFGNQLHGNIYGAEALVNVDLARRWRVSGAYSYLGLQLEHKLNAQDIAGDFLKGNNIKHQFQIHSYLKLPGNLELDNALYHASEQGDGQVPNLTRLDLRLGWKVREKIELSLGLQNLLDAHHPEFIGFDGLVVSSQVKRSIYGKVTWKF
ncbi:MAG TPA: TonB-dependent receptor [Blastocatellia bacterium]|nr:TonB-dependent receptor [Blastocatellia bacterium]